MAHLSLPSEIWRRIFRIATDFPGFLDTSPLPPALDERRAWTIRHTHPLIGDHMRTKVALVLVCKLWWRVAVEFLYEYVYIAQGEVLTSVINALKKDISTVQQFNRAWGTESRPLGWFIKRLELNLSGQRFTNTLDNEELDTLVRLCDDVQVLDIRESSVNSLTGRVPPVVTSKAQHLRYLQMEWYTDEESHCIPLLREIATIGHIQVLTLLFRWSSTFPFDSLQLPQLHTLQLTVTGWDWTGLIIGQIAGWDLPQLRSLTLYMARERTPPSILERFFVAHGPRLTTLETKAMDMALSEIVLHCPSIEDFRFSYRSPQDIPESLYRIRRVRISTSAMWRWDSSFFEGSMSALFSVTARTNLAYIQVPALSIFRTYYDEHRASFEKWVGKWILEGVLLETGRDV
jgi:hypothetical protein